ncbi:DUF397 domain-containing protein [Yinghuangia sp. ASG 101]|uniref:DUF397 domain-containing protein n=1 Tax=Yinghuangia sp. ASG 101 TaxID=2896848 RepID=UPI001E5AF22F|nr:DUF397 domain-containing protein [Yinghuangia sp. ASG 101]UGQ10826.1 DUF397 domain-containing protein [Yinghuangia sp. ASG 101]
MERTWRKSSSSNQAGGDCVEVAEHASGTVPVRDSKDVARGLLAVSASSWASLTDALKLPD